MWQIGNDGQNHHIGLWHSLNLIFGVATANRFLNTSVMMLTIAVSDSAEKVYYRMLGRGNHQIKFSSGICCWQLTYCGHIWVY